jgi:hypothetical protein
VQRIGKSTSQGNANQQHPGRTAAVFLQPCRRRRVFNEQETKQNKTRRLRRRRDPMGTRQEKQETCRTEEF